MNTSNYSICTKNKVSFLNISWWGKHRFTKNVLISLLVSLPATLALPVEALQVQVTPKNPHLGDTLSIVINLDRPEENSSPTVILGDKKYPSFMINGNKYRAFVPTTPLETAGTRKLKVMGDGQEKNLDVSVRHRKFPTQSIYLPPGKAGLDATEYELKRVGVLKALQTPQKYWQGVFSQTKCRTNEY